MLRIFLATKTIFLNFLFIIKSSHFHFNQVQVPIIIIINNSLLLTQVQLMQKHRHNKSQRFADVPEIIQRIQQQTPKTGEYFYDYKLEQAKKQKDLLNDQDFHKKYKINFADLPISQSTIKGLTNRKFLKMTEIQRCVIPHALADRDIMAASRTGSGKTLAYLIPLIQKLYRNKFIPMDGLGAIVIVPVRQLAMQVFEVLNSFTANKEISVGLVIGGKNVDYEKQRIGNMNVLICTPGRLLQHLQETYGFQANNLQMLVLDQADVMMQMGFENTLKQIMTHLPNCQKLLFSATLTNQISLLANISLNEPEKIFLHCKQNISNNSAAQNLYETPAKLTQYCMTVQAHEKVNTLYSFLKTHRREKTIVFVSTCKQVRFLYQSFRKFKLGLPMYELQGHQKQKKRMAIYFTFCQKRYGFLISTNIASRGLDFPRVDWVIQFDIPDTAQTYIHRIGRTARFKYEGKSLVFASAAEEGFIEELKKKNIKIQKIKQNPDKYFKIQSSLQSICSQHQDVKYLAQRALISYLKFVYKAQNKSIFNIEKIDTVKLAESYGLQNAPVISMKKVQKSDSEEGEQEEEVPEKVEKLSKIQKLRLKAKMKKNEIKDMKGKKLQQKQNQNYQLEQQPENSDDQQEILVKKKDRMEKNKKSKIIEQEEKQQEDINPFQEDLLKVKQRYQPNPNQKPILSVSKNRMKKIRNEGLFDGKNKIHFDDQMNPITDEEFLKKQYIKNNEKNMHIQRDFSNKIIENKDTDMEAEKRRRKERRIKIKDSLKEEKGEILPKRSQKRIVFQDDENCQLEVDNDD